MSTTSAFLRWNGLSAQTGSSAKDGSCGSPLCGHGCGLRLRAWLAIAVARRGLFAIGWGDWLGQIKSFNREVREGKAAKFAEKIGLDVAEIHLNDGDCAVVSRCRIGYVRKSAWHPSSIIAAGIL